MFIAGMSKFRRRFDVDSVSKHTIVTYLDTIGRPATVLLTDQHTGIVYVCISSHAVPTIPNPCDSR
jgi:hypothetical protein